MKKLKGMVYRWLLFLTKTFFFISNYRIAIVIYSVMLLISLASQNTFGNI